MRLDMCHRLLDVGGKGRDGKATLGVADQRVKKQMQLKISAVAFACGFNDSNYFSEKFKRVYGFSPIKLRQKSDTYRGIS